MWTFKSLDRQLEKKAKQTKGSLKLFVCSLPLKPYWLVSKWFEWNGWHFKKLFPFPLSTLVEYWWKQVWWWRLYQISCGSRMLGIQPSTTTTQIHTSYIDDANQYQIQMISVLFFVYNPIKSNLGVCSLFSQKGLKYVSIFRKQLSFAQ